MQLISLSLENWSSYKGTNNEFVFATTPGSEITVITAKNGYGKTSILKALNFVFFGDLESKITKSDESPKLEEFPNRPALADDEEVLTAVSLKFKHEGSEWLLRREFTAKKVSGLIILGQVQKSLIKVGSGGSLSNEKIDDFINDNVINKQVSHFYFFDGVLLDAIQSQLTSKNESSRKLVMRSVENALGLRFLDHLNQNLRTCLGQIDAQIESQNKALKKNETLLEQITGDQEKLVAKKADIEKIEKLLEEQESKRATHDANLQSIDPDTKAKALLRTQHEARLKELETEEEEARVNLQLCGEKAWLSPLKEKLQGLLAEREAEETANVLVRSQYHSLKQKISDLKISQAEKSCSLCGQDHDSSKLAKIAETISILEEQLEHLPQIPDQSSSNLLKLSKAVGETQRRETVEQALTQRDKVLIQKAEFVKKIKKINDQLGDFQENIDVKWEESQRAEADSNCKKYETQLSQAMALRDQYEASLQTNRAKLTANDSVSQKDKDQRMLLATLIAGIDGSFDKFRNDMRIQVQSKATEYLAILSSEPEIYGSVDISPEYQIRIKTPEGQDLQVTNAGHKQILTTAFVSAMAAVSSDKTPFVMDTALSHLDPENSAKMLEWAKYVDQQVILLVTLKELPTEVANKILGNSIGRKYDVNRIAAEESRIEEVKE
jgi:DNA sulfur modification protein DndD